MRKRTYVSNFTLDQIQEIKDKRSIGIKKTMLCYQYGISYPTLNKILKS